MPASRSVAEAGTSLRYHLCVTESITFYPLSRYHRYRLAEHRPCKSEGVKLAVLSARVNF